MPPAVLNAANEVAVAAFLDGRSDFPGIPESSRGCSNGTDRGGDDRSNRCSRPIAGHVIRLEAMLARTRPGQGHDDIELLSWRSWSPSASWSRCTSSAISGWRGARLPGAALLGRFRQAAVDAAAAPTAPSTRLRPSRSGVTSSCSTSAKGRLPRPSCPRPSTASPSGSGSWCCSPVPSPTSCLRCRVLGAVHRRHTGVEARARRGRAAFDRGRARACVRRRDRRGRAARRPARARRVVLGHARPADGWRTPSRCRCASPDGATRPRRSRIDGQSAAR